ncbi:MAG TPA: hypothetical protein VEL74_17120 [Thermoanaerobaculia bacterium]|nr:hypothetical protein [Thermoanaerobaculia bacterium]
MNEMEPPLTGAGPPGPERPERPDSPGRRTSEDVLGRTWEMELLISGGVLFALFQLSGALNQVFERAEPHLGLDSFVGLFLVYSLGKIILYTLIASFILHLAVRGYWIGLIGLQSVFPAGPNWEQVKYGPLARQLYREMVPSLPRMIQRANGFCSVIFSFAAILVLVCIVTIGWAGVFAVVAYGISKLFLDGQYLFPVLMALFMSASLVTLIAQGVDKALGERLVPAGRPARVIRAMLRGYYRLFLESLYRPIFLTLFSNFRKKAIYAVYYFVFFGLFGLFIVKDLLIRRDVLTWSSYVYLPDSRDESAMDFVYYESQRPEGEIYRASPSIQDDVIRDPYLELFIPYAPIRHDLAIRKRCPGVEPLAEPGPLFGLKESEPRPGSDPQAVLRCLAGIHKVSLDGKPLRPDFLFYTHPRTEIRGILAYIPTEGLAKGSHLLRVEAVPKLRKEDAPRPEPYLIRFWI